MKHLFVVVVFILFVFSVNAQIKNNFHYTKGDYSPAPAEVIDNYNKTQSVGAIINWKENFTIQSDGSYIFKFKTPVTFTSFGVGWNPNTKNFPASAFTIKYRARNSNKSWSKWYENEGYIKNEETPTNLYWTDLLFLDNEQQHNEIEFIITPPQGVSLSYVSISLIDITGTDGTSELQNKKTKSVNQTQSCPDLPAITPRSSWCGSYTACHNTTSYTNISPTHTVVHHGASPDTYTDGATVVRGYWNYHVNTLGWADIGYNYLFDKVGNLFQGRHNPNMPNTDVRGAHAGSANDGSIGLNFLGNADVTLPTTVQLDKLKAFLAWWYDNKGFDPTTSTGMTTQAYGWQVMPRICGHLDVGQTTCPGTNLYALLPSIRSGTKSIIDACGVIPPTGPSSLQCVAEACPSPGFTVNWSNSGTGWYIQVSAASDYSNPYQKWVSGLTSYTGPGGFVLQSNGTTPLTLINGTTYYWRIWDGSTFTVGPSFYIPYCDAIAPTSNIASPGNWKTQDFISNFTDADNSGGSGVAKRFYQVLDFDGNYWRANAQRGFLGDNFDNLDTSIWEVPTSSGSWSIISGALVQSDESVNNTNIYTALDQTLSNKYLYHFTAKVEGATSTNGRRFGFHFFCDDASLSNRGNSYFIWFRIETNKLEFYKVTNDVFTMVDEIDDIATTTGTIYDFKIIYDRITGEQLVYRNDTLIGSWKDSNPYSTNGNYISFRSGNSKLTVNDIKVYRSRTNTASVTVGSNPTNDIRYQNLSPLAISAKIKSIVIDSAGNVSPIAYHDLNIDWTYPTDIGFVNDGSGADIDTTSSYTQIEANWGSSSDPNSDIADYWYAIGTAPGDSNIVGWVNNGLSTSAIHNGLNLVFNTVYYFAVKARNNAGLFNNIKISNGQVVYNNTSVLAANFIANSNTICEGDSILFTDQSTGATTYEWVFQGGMPATSNVANPVVYYNTAGVYNVELRVFDNNNHSDTLSLTNYIVVNHTPKADFTAIDTIIYLPAAFAYFTNNSADAGSYYWTFGDTAVSVDLNPWHQYTAAGLYDVTLIASNSFCKNDTLLKNHFIEVKSTDGINESNAVFGFTLLNNPVNDILNLQLSLTQTQELKVEMVDVLGRSFLLCPPTLYNAGQHTLKINTAGKYSLGLYYLVVSSADGKKSVRKVMVGGN